MPISKRRRANPPDQPEENNNHLADETESAAASLTAASIPAPSMDGENAGTPSIERTEHTPLPPFPSTLSAITNGDRVERQEYTPPIEGGRRTPRGELFRRPPQPPPQSAAAPFVASAPLQAPTHEIALPLGNLLHLAYNPGYTGSEEARALLLYRLTEESKAGGRARCWSCGSIAIAYDRWNTRSKTFGEVGIAFCEICGVWSVL